VRQCIHLHAYLPLLLLTVHLLFVVSESASAGALEAYQEQVKAGGLRASEDEIFQAASKQASLAAAQQYLHKPPNYLERPGLLTQINTLQHPKGPGWIRQSGIDENLGSQNHRANNNNLTIMLENDNEEDSDLEVIENAKIDSTQTNIGKVQRMQAHCRASINYDTPMKDLSSGEQASQHEIKQAMRFYSRQIGDGEGACKAEVIGMVDDTDENWEKGQSQTEHKRFMNIEGYK